MGLSRVPVLDGLFRRFVWSRIHFPEMEMRFLNALPRGTIDIAIDVGAALGSYSWILARKSRRVYAFEPGEQHNEYLSRLLWGTNIILSKSAAGSSNDTVELYTPGSDTNARHSATLSRANPVARIPGTSVERIQQVTLDSYLGERLAAADRVDFVKVDVEGYELEVFRGASQLLGEHHPLIVCEIEARHNRDFAHVFELLRTVSYQCYVWKSGAFVQFAGENIEALQSESDLAVRLGAEYRPADNRYINNFVFQHPLSRVKVSS